MRRNSKAQNSESAQEKLHIGIFAGIAALAFLLTAVFYGIDFFPFQPTHSDGNGYYMYLPAFFVYHDPGMHFLDRLTEDISGFSGTFFPMDTGQVVDKYTMGVAILQLPFFLAADILTKIFQPGAADGFSALYQLGNIASRVLLLFFRFLLELSSGQEVCRRRKGLCRGTAHYLRHRAVSLYYHGRILFPRLHLRNACTLSLAGGAPRGGGTHKVQGVGRHLFRPGHADPGNQCGGHLRLPAVSGHFLEELSGADGKGIAAEEFPSDSDGIFSGMASPAHLLEMGGREFYRKFLRSAGKYLARAFQLAAAADCGGAVSAKSRCVLLVPGGHPLLRGLCPLFSAGGEFPAGDAGVGHSVYLHYRSLVGLRRVLRFYQPVLCGPVADLHF